MAWTEVPPPPDDFSASALEFSGTTGRSAKNNNPLNLEYRPGSYQDKYGATLEPAGGGKDKRPRFAAFPDMMSGYLAGIEQIKLDQQKGITLSQFVHKFAPSFENPTEQLISQYANALGVRRDTPLSQIPADKLIVPMLKRESSTKIISKGGEGILGAIGKYFGPASAEAAEVPPPGFKEIAPPPADFKEVTPPESRSGTGLTAMVSSLLGPAKESIMESPERLKREVTKPFTYLPAIAETAGLMGGGPLGYAGARQTVGRVKQLIGEEPAPQTFMEAAAPVGQDIYEGTKMELEGRAIAKGVPLVARGIGKVARPFFGQIGGTGKAPLEVAQNLSKDFLDAMRGKVSGEEIVNNAKDALTRLKDVRGDAYVQAFRNLPQKEISMTPIQRDLESLMQRYRVKTGPAGEIDVSGSSVGPQAQNEIKKIIETVRNWKDTSVEGMDALKRQIADFYSPSSQARQFTTSLKNSISDAITKVVPEYGAMTKSYSEATTLIKDIEHDLMLRYQKPGISGRMTADKTLRRLSSAMKDNFEMRRELVQILGQKGQENLEEQIAGYAMSSWMPRGAAGVVAGGEAMAATMLGQILNPKMWGVLLAASPRIQGEFITVMAKGMKELRGIEVPVGKLIAFLANQQWEAKNRDKGSYTSPVFEEPKSPEKVEPESKRGFTILNQ